MCKLRFERQLEIGNRTCRCVREGIQTWRRRSRTLCRRGSVWLEQEKGKEAEEATKEGGSCIDEGLVHHEKEFGRSWGQWEPLRALNRGEAGTPWGARTLLFHFDIRMV